MKNSIHIIPLFFNTRILLLLLWVLVILALTSSCTSQKELTYLNNLETDSVPNFYPLTRPDYRIQYQDILYVSFFTMNMEMNSLLNSGGGSTNTTPMFRNEESMYIYGYTVNHSGSISLPIIGDVKVKGLTTTEVKEAIELLSKQYLKDAVVNIRLLSFKFTIIGEVNKPGTYANFNNQLTVLEAIGMGGDISDFGDRTRVLIVRPTKEGSYTYHINLQDKNLLQSEGYFLLPNDVVIVEPVRSKPFQLNLPLTSLIISTALGTISTLILMISFINSTSQ